MTVIFRKRLYIYIGERIKSFEVLHIKNRLIGQLTNDALLNTNATRANTIMNTFIFINFRDGLKIWDIVLFRKQK